MMLTKIRFTFGPTADAAPLEIDPGPMTVFVGPHDAGESRVLQELSASLGLGAHDFRSADWKLLADIEPALPAPGEPRERLLAAIKADLAPLRTVNAAESAVLNTLVKILRDPDVEPETLEEAASWLEVTGKRSMVEALVLRHRLYPPASPALMPEKATLDLIHALIERSDESLLAGGFIDLRGYCGLYKGQCIELKAGTDYEHLRERFGEHIRLIIIDEPEAALTPALAHQLGLDLVTLAAERGACVFAATHSPDFLRGCLASGQHVDIVSLRDHDGRASAQLLPPGELP
ncbi:MAG: hypothetical protein H0T76_14725 [Nannocystis sp.]|nr:hypothetical protein [Nannocystis sp.]MBA3547735.1 hypothetical protein [Nannocystis sp.]